MPRTSDAPALGWIRADRILDESDATGGNLRAISDLGVSINVAARHVDTLDIDDLAPST